MSTFTVEKLSDEFIILQIAQEDFDGSRDTIEVRTLVNKILDEVREPVFYVTDMTRVKLDLEDMMVGASVIADSDFLFFHHPKIKEVLVVSTDEGLKMAAAGLASEAFGNIAVQIFGTLDEALAYARAN